MVTSETFFPAIERIEEQGNLFALIIRQQVCPKTTTFLSTHDLDFQAGFIVYPAGSEIPKHAHHPIERKLSSTCEFLMVKKGRCEVDIYNNQQIHLASRPLGQGDMLLLNGGGHGFRVIEDLVLIEIKQGPYKGPQEKFRF